MSSLHLLPLLLLLLLCCLCCRLHVQAYPSGAGPEACPTQSPQVCHGGSPQTSASPYSLSASAGSYSPGETVNVTIAVANGSTPFIGFLVGAHRVTGNTAEFLGSFSSTPLSQPRCGANGNTGVTHVDPRPKQSVVLVWTAPQAKQGDIVFTGAIVQNYTTYWVNVASGVLKSRDYPSTNQTTTTAPTSTSQFPKDAGCGKTKACYGDCQASGLCTFLATWYKMDQSLMVTLKSVVTSGDNVWAAIGFGTQAKMNPASVTQCVVSSGGVSSGGVSSGGVRAYMAFNSGYRSQRLTPNASIGVSGVGGGVVEGVFTCTFQRQIQVGGGGPRVYNLTSPFHIMLARGTANGWDIQPHDNADAFVTDDSYDVTDHVDIGAHASSIELVKLHGCLMTVAWILSASSGLLVARFFKSVWHTQTLCDVQVWFAIHRLAMVAAFLATVAGFVVIFLHVGGWSQLSGPNYQRVHPILGTIVTVLTVLNPLMAMFRPHPNHDWRPLFNWCHFLVGTAAYVLGVVTLGIGIRIPLAEVPEYAVYCVIGFGAWHLLAHLMLEVTKCCERTDSMVGVYKDLQSFSRSFDAVGYHHFRQTVFILHVVIAVGVCVALICTITGL